MEKETELPVRRYVLIVEDEPMTALFLRRVLRANGYDVVGVASNGRDAIQLARETLPDFILMDIKMPVMNGIEATWRIMAERPVPIVVLTNYINDCYIENAQEAGACGYVFKPVSIRELMVAIEDAFHTFDTGCKREKDSLPFPMEASVSLTDDRHQTKP